MSGIVICALILIPIAAIAGIWAESERYKRTWNNGFCRCGGEWDITTVGTCTTMQCKRCNKAEFFCTAGPWF
jgi:hypothetical protein